MTTTKDRILKLDCIGRVRTSKAHREALLDAYEHSGMSGPQFAAQHGVKYQTFATWLQKRKRGSGGYPALPAPDGFPPFMLAEVETSSPMAQTPAPSLEVRLPGGAVLLLSDPAQLAMAASLLKELSSPRPC